MKNMILSWLDSLKLLLPANFIKFSQIVLKSWLKMYWTLLLNFWWLLVGGVAALFLLTNWILFIGLLVLWLLLIILAVRPSLKLKNLRYFGDNLVYGFPLLILFAVPCCLPMKIVYGIAPFLFLTMFFLCDSNLKFIRVMTSPLRAAVMSFNKLPIYGTCAGLFYFCSMLPWPINMFIAIPLLVTALSCLYTMWIHKHYKEYYEGCC